MLPTRIAILPNCPTWLPISIRRRSAMKHRLASPTLELIPPISPLLSQHQPLITPTKFTDFSSNSFRVAVTTSYDLRHDIRVLSA
jgi:hypothetical protein